MNIVINDPSVTPPGLMHSTTLIHIKHVGWRRQLHADRRFKASCGQHYIVGADGALRRCDDKGRITPRIRMSKKRRLQGRGIEAALRSGTLWS